MKKLTVILFSLALLLTAVPTHANERWSVWLYSATSNQLMRVYDDGVTESYSLPLSEGTTIVSQIAIFTGESNRIGFCSMNMTGNVEASHTVQVIDLDTNNVLMSQTFSDKQGCLVTSDSFSPDGNQLAVGTAAVIEGDPWRLAILDIASGEPFAEITAESPAIQGYVESLEYGWLNPIPWVNLFDESRIVFSLLAYRTGAPPPITAAEWKFEDNLINSTAGLGTPRSDYLPNTDEVIWVEHDSSLPATEPSGPMQSYNVVKYRDTDGNINNIYHNPEQLPIGVEFINDGYTIAIELMTPLDMTEMPPKPQIRSWVALDRSGNVTTLEDENTGNTVVIPARGGYALFKHQVTPEQANKYTLEYRKLDGVEVLWDLESSESWGVVAFTEDPVDSTQLDPFPIITG